MSDKKDIAFLAMVKYLAGHRQTNKSVAIDFGCAETNAGRANNKLLRHGLIRVAHVRKLGCSKVRIFEVAK